MLIIALFALLAVGLVLACITARRTRAFWPVTAVFAGAAVLFALHLRADDRETKRRDAEVNRWNAKVAGYCSELATSLRLAVHEYRIIVRQGSDFNAADRTSAETRYMSFSGERDRFARMCVADVSPGEWRGCVPHVLSDVTLEKIERAANAIDEHRPCAP